MLSQEPAAHPPEGGRTSRLRILYVGTLPPHQGGSAVLAAHLLRGFANRGHPVTAIAPITTASQGAGDAFAAEHPGITVVRFEVDCYQNSPDFAAPDDVRIREGRQIEQAFHESVRAQRPDVVVVGRESFAWHVPDLATTHAIPSILLVQGSTTFGICNGSIRSAHARALLDKYRKVDEIIVVAGHLQERLRALGFARTTAIPNPVDLDKFRPQGKDRSLLRHLEISDGDSVVIHASNLKKLKRPLDLVAAASEVIRCRPNVVFVIAGDGNYRKAMEDSCRERGISERFRFVGWLQHNEMPRYLNLADVVVIPSEAEGLALIYLETQACGRLLLASDIAAAREVIQDKDTGLLFKAGDVEDLAQKTMLAVDNDQLRATIGMNARKSARAHDIDGVIVSYLDRIRDVLDRRA